MGHQLHPMVLKEQELLQIDEHFIRRLVKQDPDALAGLSIKLAEDLKEAMERLNQTSSNSSRPSGSFAPWDKNRPDEGEVEDNDVDIQDQSESACDDEALSDSEEADSKATDKQGRSGSDDNQQKRKAGRQPGSQGFGRTQKLDISHTKHHRCGPCCVCNEDISTVEKAYTGFQTINIEFGDVNSPGVQLSNTQHLYYAGECPNCGLENRAEPGRAPANRLNWENVGLTEWRLIGPDLAAMIIYLSMDMRLTRRKVQLFLQDIFGLQLSIGSIQNCIVESARALAPVEEQLVEELLSESLLHADETSHNEAGTRLWLWVFISSTTALFFVGYRSKEIFTNLLDSFAPGYDGWLMSDGYCIYRDYLKRLRCWAHLIRKAKGLSESYTKTSRFYGKQVLDEMNALMDAVYHAREGPDKGKVSIASEHLVQLNRLQKTCKKMSASSHKKSRELGREFLNDWEAIFHVLDYPAWPLTNNEAERALRHWVILRRITQGTRSEQGSRALALFASVITTCRLRACSPLLYIRDVINMRRQGNDAPALPCVSVQQALTG